MARLPGDDAVGGIGAEDQLVVAADRVDAAGVARPQQACRVSASTQPTAAWNERAHSRVAQRAPPGRSGRPGARPRWCRAARPPAPPSAACRASGRCRPGAGPARRSACPCTAASTPICGSVSASPGRCSVHSRWPSRASKACTARSTPITKTRSPATSGAVLTREFERSRHSSLPPSKRDQLVVARHHRCEAAVAADAGGQRARRRWRARARGRSRLRSASTRAVAGGDDEAAVALTTTDSGKRTPSTLGRPDLAAGDLRRHRLQRLGLGLVGRAAGQHGQQPAAARRSRPAARRRVGITCRPPRPWRAGAGRRRRRAQRGELGVDQAPVLDLRRPSPSRPPGRRLRASSVLPWASSTSPRRSATSASKSSAPWPRRAASARRRTSWPVEQQAGQAQAGHGLVLVLAGVVGHPGEAGLGGVGLALVELHLARPAARPAAAKAVRG